MRGREGRVEGGEEGEDEAEGVMGEGPGVDEEGAEGGKGEGEGRAFRFWR